MAAPNGSPSLNQLLLVGQVGKLGLERREPIYMSESNKYGEQTDGDTPNASLLYELYKPQAKKTSKHKLDVGSSSSGLLGQSSKSFVGLVLGSGRC